MYGTPAANDIPADARWGARLIASEIRAGGTGIVHDRTTMTETVDGASDSLAVALNRQGIDQIAEAVRERSASSITTEFDATELVHDGDLLVLGEARGGYVHVTALWKAAEWTDEAREDDSNEVPATEVVRGDTITYCGETFEVYGVHELDVPGEDLILFATRPGFPGQVVAKTRTVTMVKRAPTPEEVRDAAITEIVATRGVDAISSAALEQPEVLDALRDAYEAGQASVTDTA